MNKILMELYTFATDRLFVAPDYQEKIRALAMAKLAILNELEQETGEKIAALLDVYSSLDGERQEMREQMVFKAGLDLGMELGRLGIRT